jgi:hypothetical protein
MTKILVQIIYSQPSLCNSFSLIALHDNNPSITSDTATLKVSGIHSLMRLALPEKQAEFIQALQTELGWEERPKLISSRIDS